MGKMLEVSCFVSGIASIPWKIVPRARVKDSQSFSHDLFVLVSNNFLSLSFFLSASFILSHTLSFIHISVISYKAVVNNFFLSLFFKKKKKDPGCVKAFSVFIFQSTLCWKVVATFLYITNNACVNVCVCVWVRVSVCVYANVRINAHAHMFIFFVCVTCR